MILNQQWLSCHDSPSAQPPQQSTPSCILCKEAGHQPNHYLSKFPYLPPANKQFCSKVQVIAALDDEIADLELTETDMEDSNVSQINMPTSQHVQINHSPSLNTFYGHHPIKITIDSGAETNMIKTTTAHQVAYSCWQNQALSHQRCTHIPP